MRRNVLGSRLLLLFLVYSSLPSSTTKIRAFQVGSPISSLSSSSFIASSQHNTHHTNIQTNNNHKLLRREKNHKGTSTSLSSTTLSSIVTSFSYPASSLCVLCFVVLFHEAGHFLAARSFGISVSEFSVGVGPKIAGFTRRTTPAPQNEKDEKKKKKKGFLNIGKKPSVKHDVDTDEDAEEIEFSLRALPLGGYVRFPENYNTTLAMERDDEARQRRRDIRENEAARKKNDVNHNKGILSFLPNRSSPTEEETSNSKSWKNIFSNKTHNKNKKNKQNKDPPEIEYYDDPNLLQNRPWPQKAVVMSGGIVFNIILAFSLYLGELTVGNGLPQPKFDQGAVISMVPRSDGPSYGILDKGDVIVGLNGNPLSTVSSPSAATSQKDISNLISKIRQTTPGEPLTFSVIKYPNQTPKDITIRPYSLPNKGPTSIGVILAPNFIGTELYHPTSLSDAILKSTTAVLTLTSQTFFSLLSLLSSVISGAGPPPGQGLSGPIGLIKTGADVTRTGNLDALIEFCAAISVNLAVVNAFPLPALDGGQLAFVLVEAISGRKVDQRIQEGVTAVAFLFLLLVSFGAALGDVTSIVSR